MKIKAAKIELTVGGTMITCHDAEIDIPYVVDERKLNGILIHSGNEEFYAKPEPVGKTDKPQRKEKKSGSIVGYGICENCNTEFMKNTKAQRFCSTDCVRAYARRCKQPKLQQMITGVKNDYAPFTPQP